MPTLYTKISPANVPYLDSLADAAGISKGRVVDLIITEARLRGWSVATSEPRIMDRPGPPSPAAGPHSSTPQDKGEPRD
jgi:hypothetical protein